MIVKEIATDNAWQDHVVRRRPSRWDKPPSYEGLVFISCPSSGIIQPRSEFKDARDRENILLTNAGSFLWPPFTMDFLKVMALLREESPDAEFFSPSLQNYMILPFMKYGTSHDYSGWKDRCRLALERCDRVLLCPFAGWQTSTGVQDEITVANQLGKPVHTDVHRLGIYPDPQAELST